MEEFVLSTSGKTISVADHQKVLIEMANIMIEFSRNGMDYLYWMAEDPDIEDNILREKYVPMLQFLDAQFDLLRPCDYFVGNIDDELAMHCFIRDLKTLDVRKNNLEAAIIDIYKKQEILFRIKEAKENQDGITC